MNMNEHTCDHDFGVTFAVRNWSRPVSFVFSDDHPKEDWFRSSSLSFKQFCDEVRRFDGLTLHDDLSDHLTYLVTSHSIMSLCHSFDDFER